MESLVIFSGVLDGSVIPGTSPEDDLAAMRYAPWPVSHRLVHSREPTIGYVDIQLSYVAADWEITGQSIAAATALELRSHPGEPAQPRIIVNDPREAFKLQSGREVVTAIPVTVIQWDWTFSGTPLNQDDPTSGSYLSWYRFGSGRMQEAGPNFQPSFPWLDENPAISFSLPIEEVFRMLSMNIEDPDGTLPPSQYAIYPSQQTVFIDPATSQPWQPDFAGVPAPSVLHWTTLEVSQVQWIHPPGY